MQVQRTQRTIRSKFKSWFSWIQPEYIWIQNTASKKINAWMEFLLQASRWSTWGRLGSTRCSQRWSCFQVSSRVPWLLWSHPIWYQSEYYILWPKISVCSGHLFGDLHPGKWLPSYVWKMTFQIQQSLFRRDVLLTFFLLCKIHFHFYWNLRGVPGYSSWAIFLKNVIFYREIL